MTGYPTTPPLPICSPKLFLSSSSNNRAIVHTFLTNPQGGQRREGQVQGLRAGPGPRIKVELLSQTRGGKYYDSLASCCALSPSGDFQGSALQGTQRLLESTQTAGAPCHHWVPLSSFVCPTPFLYMPNLCPGCP